MIHGRAHDENIHLFEKPLCLEGAEDQPGDPTSGAREHRHRNAKAPAFGVI